MKDSIRAKLDKLAERHEEVSGLLADPTVIANNNQFRDLSVEYSRLEPVVTLGRQGKGGAVMRIAFNRLPEQV